MALQLVHFIHTLQLTEHERNEIDNFFANTTNEEIAISCNNFCVVNNDSWIADYELDMNKCADTCLHIGTRQLDLCTLTQDHMSKIQRQTFWRIVSELGGRALDVIENHRQAQLSEALQLFASNLKTIDVHIGVDDLRNFIASNREAIENRYLQCLQPKLNIPLNLKADVDTFWNHMEQIYNIMHPYNRIKRNIASDLVSNIVHKISTSQSTSPTNLIGEIISNETLEQMAHIMSTPNGLPNILSSLMSVINTNNGGDDTVDVPNMTNILGTLMNSLAK